MHARAFFAQAEREAWRLVTTNAVVFESHARLLNRSRPGREIALQFLEAVETDTYHVVRGTKPEEEKAVALVHAHEDRLYSLCDALSFVVVERLRIREVVGFLYFWLIRRGERRADFRIRIQRIDCSATGIEDAGSGCVAVAHFTIENKGNDSIASDWRLDVLEAFNEYTPSAGEPIWVHICGDGELMSKPLEHNGRRVGSIAFMFRNLPIRRALQLPQIAWAISCADAVGRRHIGRWM